MSESEVTSAEGDLESSHLESVASSKKSSPQAKPSDWLKVGAIAAGSALAGGMLAAWWYRKTLDRLREAEDDGQNPHFGKSGEDSDEEA